jgi:hypothetical protein
VKTVDLPSTFRDGSGNGKICSSVICRVKRLGRKNGLPKSILRGKADIDFVAQTGEKSVIKYSRETVVNAVFVERHLTT